MTITPSAAQSYGYTGVDAPAGEPPKRASAENPRKTYDTMLLERMDDRAYRAFENATLNASETEKESYAKALERNIAREAANRYALVHDIDNTQEIEVVYAFFEAYHDVVSTEEIKHLLNVKLQTPGHPPGDQSKIENFFNDYLAQLGGTRALDILV